MEIQMGFWETPFPKNLAPVWATLDHETRTEVVTILARLIAKMAAAQRKRIVSKGEEKNDE